MSIVFDFGKNRNKKIRQAVWVDTFGRRRFPKDLDDSHIVNIINYMRENAHSYAIDELQRDYDFLTVIDITKKKDEKTIGLEWLAKQDNYIAVVIEAMNRGLITLKPKMGFGIKR